MTNYFKRDFDRYVCEGDTISATVGGIDYTARLERDTDTTPMEYDQPGWVYDTTDPKYGKRNREIIAAWSRDEWHYFTVVIDAERNGWRKENIASLSGIEGNFPSRAKNPNRYFRTVANELLGGLLKDDRPRSNKLMSLIGGTE